MTAAQHARFDKHGRRLPDTGRGCGCRLCEQANAPRYERRSEPEREGDAGEWNPLQRSLVRLVRGIS
jgi:hypothetical protein